MPDLLAELRKLLAQTPLTRDIVVTSPGYVVDWTNPHWQFTEKEFSSEIYFQFRTLEKHGLVQPVLGGVVYRMTERLAMYLWKSKPS